MRNSQRSITTVSPVQALHFAALLACSGSTEGVRRTAARVVESRALPVVWAFLTRYSDARVSWLRLTSVTHEATCRFLREWPTSAALTTESMMSTLQACTRAVAGRVAPEVTTSLPLGRLGVLTLLSACERHQLLQSVQGALTAAELRALHAAVAGNNGDRPAAVNLAFNEMNAIEHLETLLLRASIYTLGVENDTSGIHHLLA